MQNIQGINFFTCEEVAEKLSMKVSTIRRYIRCGEMQARKVGRSYLVSDEQLRAYVGNKYGIPYDGNGASAGE